MYVFLYLRKHSLKVAGYTCIGVTVRLVILSVYLSVWCSVGFLHSNIVYFYSFMIKWQFLFKFFV